MKRLNFVLCLVCALSVGSTARADSAVALTFNAMLLPVSGLNSGVTAVAAGAIYGSGGAFSLAVQDGGANAWGRNDSGQLGDGTTTSRSTLMPVTGLGSIVTAVAASDNGHSLSVQNGALYAWGLNWAGKLGDGTVGGLSSTPVPVSGMDGGVTAIAAGTYHSLAVMDAGLNAWGSNYAGELGGGTMTTSFPYAIPTPVPIINLLSGATEISAGERHSLAVSLFPAGHYRLQKQARQLSNPLPDP